MTDEEIQVRLDTLPPKEAAKWISAELYGDGVKRHVQQNFAGLKGYSLTTFEDFLVEVESRLARWKQGRYLIVEAAQLIADANEGLDAGHISERLQDAAQDPRPVERLILRKSGLPLPTNKLPVGRCWDSEVRLDDLNAWLTKTNAGYVLGYPYREGDPHRTMILDEPIITVAPKLKQSAQESRIIEIIKSIGYAPTALPRRKAGVAGIKADVKKLALKEKALFTSGTFDDAWQRLRDDKLLSEVR